MAWCDSYVGNKHRAKIWQSYTHARAAVSADTNPGPVSINHAPGSCYLMPAMPAMPANYFKGNTDVIAGIY